MSLAYWHCGGEVICAGGLPLADGKTAHVQRRRLALARKRARDGDPLQYAAELLAAMQLRRALAERRAWRRAANASYDSLADLSRAANSSRELTLGGALSGIGSPRNSQSGAQPCEAW